MSSHHRLPPPPPLLIPIHRLCGCRSSAGLEQCAPLHPTSAIRLSKMPTLPFIQLRVLGIGCDLIFSLWVNKEKGKKEKKIEESYFDLKAVRFRSISVYRGKGYKGKEEFRTTYLFFFSVHRIFQFGGFRFKVILLYLVLSRFTLHENYFYSIKFKVWIHLNLQTTSRFLPQTNQNFKRLVLCQTWTVFKMKVEYEGKIIKPISHSKV